MTREPPEMDPDTESDEWPYGEVERPGVSARHRILTLIVALSAIGAFAGVVWYAYTARDTVTAEAVTVPLIRADEAPLKVRPEDPGGMRVPDQDKLVYDRIAPGVAAPVEAERLLPPPESPLPPPPPPPPPAPRVAPAPQGIPQPPPLPPADLLPPSALGPPSALEPPGGPPAPVGGEGTLQEAGEDPIAALIEDQVSVGALDPEAVQAATGIPVPVPRPATLATRPVAAAQPPATQPQPPAAQPPAAQPPAAAGQTAAGGYRVQFAAVRGEDEARQEWARIRGAHGALLGAVSLNVERADLGQRGVFYRVQAGPLADAAAARSLCTALESRNQPCLVVAP